MGNVLELRLQAPGINGIDINTTEMAKDFAELQKRFSDEFAKMKARLEQSKTLDEAKKFLNDVPLYADAGNLTLKVGDSYIKAKDKEEFDKYKNDIETTMSEMNKKLAEYEQKMLEEQKKTTDNSKGELDEVKKNVTIEKKEQDGIVREYDRQTGISTFTLENWIRLNQQKQGDAGSSFMVDPAGKMQSRQAKQLDRRIDRHMDIKNEKRKARKLEKDARKAEKLRDNVARQKDAMAQIGGDVMGAAENRKQTLYYEQVAKLAMEEFKKGKYNAEDTVYINTYNPLFTVEGLNPSGKVGIRLTLDQVAQYNENMRISNDPRLAPYLSQEDKEVINKGGILGAGVDWMVQHTNYPPESAPALKSAAKLGAIIGLGILGWQTIKRVFNIGGKYSAGERRGWGLGALGVLVGVPALTGQRIDQLLFSGDAKLAWEKTKDLFSSMGIETGELLGNTDEKVMDPAMGNLLFGGLTVEEARKYITYKDGKYTMRQSDFTNYLIEQEAKETDPVKKQTWKDKLALWKKAILEKKADKIGNNWGKSIGLHEAADKDKTTEELYTAYLEGLHLGAGLLAGDKKLKIKDLDAFNAYVREQIVDKGRDPASITKKELLEKDLLEEVVEEGTKDADTKEDNNNTKNNKQNNKPADNTGTAEDVGTREKVTNRTSSNWKKFKGAVAATGATIAGWFGMKKKPDSPQLKAAKDKLQEMKDNLAELEAMDETKRKQVATAEDIKEAKDQIKDAEYQLTQIEAMDKAIDPVLEPLVKNKKLSQNMAEQLTEAKNNLNLQYELINRNNQHAMIHFVEDHGQLFVASYNEQLPITIAENADKKTFTASLADCPLQFNTMESLVQTANFVNFLVMNYQYTSQEANPFYVDGDEISMSGPGIDKDMLENLYPDIRQPRTQKFVDWLNNKKGSMGVSIWLETGRPNNDVLRTVKELERVKLDSSIYGGLISALPGQYARKKISTMDESALRKNAQGEVIGYGKIEAAFDGQGLVFKTHGRETAIMKDGREWKVGDFKYSLETPQEALYIANFVNYCKRYLEYATTGTEPFNMSFTDKYLEFAQHSDREYRWGLSDIKNDLKLARKEDLIRMSNVFANKTVRKEFAAFLNRTYPKWHG